MDEVALAERSKYLQVWNHPTRAYSAYSPGAEEAPRALAWWASLAAPANLRDFSAIDYGCGEGKALILLASKLGHVTGIDVAPVCPIRNHPKIKFVEAPLWGFTSPVQSSFSFSCDVLEHIPPEKLDLSIAAIRVRTSIAGWIRIGTTPDGFGPRLISQKLHLVVEQPDWWEAKLKRFFDHVTIDRTGDNFVVFKVMP